MAHLPMEGQCGAQGAGAALAKWEGVRDSLDDIREVSRHPEGLLWSSWLCLSKWAPVLATRTWAGMAPIFDEGRAFMIPDLVL